jgi:hypothetical protein
MYFLRNKLSIVNFIEAVVSSAALFLNFFGLI